MGRLSSRGSYATRSLGGSSSSNKRSLTISFARKMGIAAAARDGYPGAQKSRVASRPLRASTLGNEYAGQVEMGRGDRPCSRGSDTAHRREMPYRHPASNGGNTRTAQQRLLDRSWHPRFTLRIASPFPLPAATGPPGPLITEIRKQGPARADMGPAVHQQEWSVSFRDLRTYALRGIPGERVLQIG